MPEIDPPAGPAPRRRAPIRAFARAEDGAVTAEFVVLCAVAASLAMVVATGVLPEVRGSAERLSGTVSGAATQAAAGALP